MGLVNLSSPRRGRPAIYQNAETQVSAKRLTVLEQLWYLRRITKIQKENALQFKRLAITVYPAMGAPNMITGQSKQYSTICDDAHPGAFRLWKAINAAIENQCGAFALHHLTLVLLEDEIIPGLLEDNSISQSTIRSFCYALDLIGSVIDSYQED